MLGLHRERAPMRLQDLPVPPEPVPGWAGRTHQIAPALFITERTVACHVEYIVAKLAVPSRTLAAVRALRYGLYVPQLLNGVPPS